MQPDQVHEASLEYRLRLKDGVYRWFRDRHVLVFDADDRPHAVIGNIRDITTEKDAVKLGTIPACRDLPLYYMKIALEVEPEFFAYMISRIGPLSCT